MNTEPIQKNDLPGCLTKKAAPFNQFAYAAFNGTGKRRMMVLS